MPGIACMHARLLVTVVTGWSKGVYACFMGSGLKRTDVCCLYKICLETDRALLFRRCFRVAVHDKKCPELDCCSAGTHPASAHREQLQSPSMCRPIMFGKMKLMSKHFEQVCPATCCGYVKRKQPSDLPSLSFSG